MVASTLEKKSDQESNTYLDWPVKRWTFSHVDNITYAINQLNTYSKTLKHPVRVLFIKGMGNKRYVS